MVSHMGGNSLMLFDEQSDVNGESNDLTIEIDIVN